MKEIILSRGKVALIDDEDFERVSQYKWCATKTTWGDDERAHWYAMRYINKRGVLLHRFILNEPPYKIDHRNGNGLDNQRSNLRPATTSQNAANSRRNTAMSGFKGVYPSSTNQGTWRARICVDDQRMTLGTYSSPEEAAMAYGLAALQFFGEFARMENES